VDLVVCATASAEPILDAALLAGRTRPLVIFDLAVPRDVAADVVDVPGVTLIDLTTVGSASIAAPSQADRSASEAIVAAEVEAFVAWLRGANVAPTVAALRTRADEVVAAELRRLRQRTPDLTEEHRAEVALAVHRVVQQLLHQPTVRVRQLAATPSGDQYIAVLQELFDLKVPDLGAATPGEVGRAMDVQP
jgi:glutamyl-tRNA reductase